MIDETVLNLAHEFRTVWNSLLSKYPKYSLDLSWTSVGIVDLLTGRLRGKKDYSPEEIYLLNGAAAYLGGIAHDCWVQFPDSTEVELTCDGTSDYPVTIKAKKGKHLGRSESFTVNISEVLNKLFTDFPNPIPVFEKTERHILPSGNIASLFGIGLCSGLCPFGNGPWKDKTTEEFSDNLAVCEALLAKTSAEYYKRVFPSEVIGHNPDIYRFRLVLPPAAHGESFLASHATTGLATYLKNQIEDVALQRKIAFNLAQSPDELISLAGLAVSVALIEDTPSTELQLLSLSKSDSNYLLRPAVVIARKVFEKPHDWVSAMNGGDIETVTKLYRTEKMLGFLPHCRLSEQSLRYADLLPLFYALTWVDLRAAYEILLQLSKSEKLLPELFLKKIYLLLQFGDIEQAEHELMNWESEYPSVSDSEKASYLEIKGLVYLEKKDNDIKAAQEAFREVSMMTNVLPDQTVRNLDHLIWTSLLLGKKREALEFARKSLSLSPGNFSSKLNQYFLLSDLQENDLTDSTLSDLYRASPMNRPVFDAALKAELGQTIADEVEN